MAGEAEGPWGVAMQGTLRLPPPQANVELGPWKVHRAESRSVGPRDTPSSPPSPTPGRLWFGRSAGKCGQSPHFPLPVPPFPAKSGDWGLPVPPVPVHLHRPPATFQGLVSRVHGRGAGVVLGTPKGHEQKGARGTTPQGPRTPPAELEPSSVGGLSKTRAQGPPPGNHQTLCWRN